MTEHTSSGIAGINVGSANIIAGFAGRMPKVYVGPDIASAVFRASGVDPARFANQVLKAAGVTGLNAHLGVAAARFTGVAGLAKSFDVTGLVAKGILAQTPNVATAADVATTVAMIARLPHTEREIAKIAPSLLARLPRPTPATDDPLNPWLQLTSFLSPMRQRSPWDTSG